MARDIVCDMLVNEDEAAKRGLMTEYGGRTFYFCGKSCKRQFEADPEKFGKDKPADVYTGASAAEKAPIHPPTVL